MSSSEQKGNIGSFLLTLSVIAFIFIIVLVAQSMITEGIPAGKYKNPNVSTYIVEGSVYDVNGRTLSLEIPTYNCFFDTSKMNSAQLELAIETTSFYSNISAKEIKDKVKSTLKSYFFVGTIDEKAVEEFSQTLENYNLSNAVIIDKNYQRNYPAMFHASQIISEVEKNMSNVISPRPGYNTATTYGQNIFLTIDLDVQYILDLAVQELYAVCPSEYVYAFVMNADDGSVLGMSTYPYYDLNTPDLSDAQKTNKALLSNFNGLTPNFISKITDKGGKTVFTGEEYDTTVLNFTRDYASTVQSLSSNLTSVKKAVPALEKPKYYIVVGVANPENKNNNYVVNTADYIEDGLRSQSKI